MLPDVQHPVPGQQRPPHTGPEQELTQDPAVHVWADVQARPQIPQLAGLVWRSTHVVPHRDRPLAHPHWLAEQVWPVGHTWPQVPQLRGSRVVSTQAIPDPEGQVVRVQTHVPWEQTKPEPLCVVQENPQAPQLDVLVAVSTQVPVEALSGQSLTVLGDALQVQTPPPQDPSPHARPQIPQLAGLAWRSTQLPWHGAWPSGQEQVPLAQVAPA